MTDFCDFVPDDPSCQTADPVVDDTLIDSGDGGLDGGDAGPGPDDVVDPDDMGDDGHMDGDHHDGMDHHDMMPMGKMDGQWTWEDVEMQLDEWLQPSSGFRNAIMTTTSITAMTALQLFRYQKRTPDYFTSSGYVAGTGKTDYYKMAHLVYGYGYLGIFGFLTVMHLLAWMGIMANTDYLLTMFIDFFGFPLLHLAGGVLVMLAYDNAYTISQDTTSSYQALGLALMTQIQNEMTALMAMEIGRYLEAWSNNGNWTYAHYLKLDEENRDWWRENAMFQRWIIGMGIPIWHLIEEQESKDSSWQDAVDQTVQQLIHF